MKHKFSYTFTVGAISFFIEHILLLFRSLKIHISSNPFPVTHGLLTTVLTTALASYLLSHYLPLVLSLFFFTLKICEMCDVCYFCHIVPCEN